MSSVNSPISIYQKCRSFIQTNKEASKTIPNGISTLNYLISLEKKINIIDSEIETLKERATKIENYKKEISAYERSLDQLKDTTENKLAKKLIESIDLEGERLQKLDAVLFPIVKIMLKQNHIDEDFKENLLRAFSTTSSPLFPKKYS